MFLKRVAILSAALVIAAVASIQSSYAADLKEFMAVDQTPAGAAIAAEGDVLRVAASQELEVSMEAIADETGKDAAADGSTFDVFVTFNAAGTVSRINAGQIVMEAGHADLVISGDAAELGCAPLACGVFPAGFGTVETISRVEIIANTVLDPATELPMASLAGRTVLDSGTNPWGARVR